MTHLTTDELLLVEADIDSPEFQAARENADPNIGPSTKFLSDRDLKILVYAHQFLMQQIDEDTLAIVTQTEIAEAIADLLASKPANIQPRISILMKWFPQYFGRIGKAGTGRASNYAPKPLSDEIMADFNARANTPDIPDIPAYGFRAPEVRRYKAIKADLAKILEGIQELLHNTATEYKPEDNIEPDHTEPFLNDAIIKQMLQVSKQFSSDDFFDTKLERGSKVLLFYVLMRELSYDTADTMEGISIVLSARKSAR